MNERLARDHGELDQLFYELCVAFQLSDVTQIHTRLDLFWARLAVHIRAEHLHLFPAILGAISGVPARDAADEPSLVQAQSVVRELRQDHDFFMHELSRAIKTTRSLLTTEHQELISLELGKVEAKILVVAERLRAHNKLEEEGIYVWGESLLDELQRSQLRASIQNELGKMPPRFASPS